MSDSALNRQFSEGNEVNRVRAIELVKDGSINKESTKHMCLSARIEEIINIIIFIRFIDPLIKTESHNTAAD